MAAQTVRPSRWIIVNDGSSDATGSIIDAASRNHPWIKPVHRGDRGFRQQGGGVVEAFMDGLRSSPVLKCDFLVKFDADLSFTPDYFTRCFAKFAEDPTLGIGGGLISFESNGALVCESPKDPAFHVRGATKIYRHTCWDAIGGLIPAPGWDTIDELKANMLGWSTRSFPDVPLCHHRHTGTVDGTWKNLVKFGLANYVTAYHPLFMAAKCTQRMLRPPYLVGAVALAYGFGKGYVSRRTRIVDKALISYIRRQQMNRLFHRPSIWDKTIGETIQA